MNIPANGRIAIIDDQIEQAFPLINVLSKNQCPFSYFSGEEKFLPQEGNNYNDIRILFLDINLIDNANHENKVLKARLIPVLKRVISEKNFPYILVYWSRHENEHKILVEDIFKNDLPDRKPIAFLSQNKLNYFNLDGTQTDQCEELTAQLFETINNAINENPSYSYLLNWENQAHFSIDKTMEEVFKSCHTYESWTENANFLINKLGESYAGKNSYKTQTPEEKIKSSYQAFNNVYFDTIEYSTNNSVISNPVELTYNLELANTDSIYTINKKLLISDERDVMEYSGTVTEDSNSTSDKAFEELLNNSFNRKVVEDIIVHDPANKEKDKKELDKMINNECSSKRKEIRSTWKKIYFVATPLCDFVQKKYYNSRVVKGILIKAEHLKFIDEKSEAIFISPKFKLDADVYVIVLHFRYFFTANNPEGIKGLIPMFRVRQQLLAEVQSKLARHISRQGVLFLDERN